MARKPHVRHEAARVHHAARRNGGRLPVAARAQGARNLPKVGFLFPGTERIAPTRIAQMAEGLRAVGYRAPDQIELIARVTGGDPSRVAPMARELVDRNVDVLVPISLAGVQAVRLLTSTIPIVAFDLETDAVGSGLVKSLARPGGNITGVFFDFPEFSKKWLELMKEALPQLAKIGVLWDPATGFTQLRAIYMSSMRPVYLRSELVTPSKLEAAKMPTLHGLDEEFGQVAGVNQLDRTRSILLAGALGAAILGGLTLAWLAVDGSVRPKVASSAPTSPRNTAPVESRELVDRLLSQVEALKSEVRKLTEAQQQPAHAIAAIEAEQESRNRAPPVHWYQTPLRCRPGWRADRSRGASCRFRDGQRAHVLHCVRCSRPFPRAALRALHLATVQRSAGAVKAESLRRALMNAQIEGPLSAANRKTSSF